MFHYVNRRSGIVTGTTPLLCVIVTVMLSDCLGSPLLTIPLANEELVTG